MSTARTIASAIAARPREGRRAAPAPAPVLQHLGDGAAHVDVDQVGAGRLDGPRGLGHRVRLGAEELDADRVLVGDDRRASPSVLRLPWWMPKLATISDTARPAPCRRDWRRKAQLAMPGQGRLHEAVLEREAADREALREAARGPRRAASAPPSPRARPARRACASSSPPSPCGHVARARALGTFSSWTSRRPSRVSSGSFWSICSEWRQTSAASPPVATTTRPRAQLLLHPGDQAVDHRRGAVDDARAHALARSTCRSPGAGATSSTFTRRAARPVSASSEVSMPGRSRRPGTRRPPRRRRRSSRCRSRPRCTGRRSGGGRRRR